MIEHKKNVEVRRPTNTWRKPTFRAQVRQLTPGQSVQVPTDATARNSCYLNAKNACPDARFSVQKQPDNTFLLIRVA